MTIVRLSPVLAFLAAASAVRADYKTMDYGPFLNATYAIKMPAGNTAYRGTALGFDVPPGKTITHAQAGYIFDTEMLRPAAWWTGGFLKLDGVVFSGGHGANPSPVGTVLLSTRPIPGVAKDGDFKDPREIPYGPLPRDWARFKGLYRSGDRVVFEYTVGGASVRELPEQEDVRGVKVLSRTLNLGPSPRPVTLVVADLEGGKGRAEGTQAAVEHVGWVVTEVVSEKKGKRERSEKRDKQDFVTLARVQGLDGLTLKLSADGRLTAFQHIGILSLEFHVDKLSRPLL